MGKYFWIGGGRFSLFFIFIKIKYDFKLLWGAQVQLPLIIQVGT